MNCWKPADRIQKLPTYLFAAIDKMKSDAVKAGRSVIDLGIGDPDLPTPNEVIESLYTAAKNPINHRYPSYSGMGILRVAIADWYKRRFGVVLDPDSEVLPLIGSKEGIAHIPLAFINQGDVVLFSDPGYPVYNASTILAGGIPCSMPLLKENNFLPIFENIDKNLLHKAKLMFVNYPNNPTSQVAPESFYKNLINFAEKHRILVCHDAAYSEIAYDGYRPLSFLQIKGAKEVGIEFHSLSKTYNMTGWRIGFVVGNREAIALLGKVKTNIDSGIFQAVQHAGITALNLDPQIIEKNNKIYQERRDILALGLNKLGWEVEKPKATFYMWMSIPNGYSSLDFSRMLLEKADIVCTPGIGFGTYGEGYIRFALTVDKEIMKKVIERLNNLNLSKQNVKNYLSGAGI
ncbi:MAG: LL-diaminopimelate aminotransferase [Candidatus Firestonebacteria bacterium]|nr:LL-diaminopimelate aminotransferase [Candidatus Firestonebacteria bacterium]